ncbi:MAG: hypothetical protein PWP34_2164 [Desulfuromonadales bacterium]|nr:hypothetical protein [Desulfuromonadales bacterium]
MQELRYWFPARKYGWGWGLPCAWQGWAVFFIFALLFSIGFYLFPPQRKTLLFVGYNALVSIEFIVICHIKGEPAAWRWGRKKGE